MLIDPVELAFDDDDDDADPPDFVAEEVPLAVELEAEEVEFVEVPLNPA